MRVELTKTGVAIRRLAVWHPAHAAGRQGVEPCIQDLESRNRTVERPTNEARTESPERPEYGECVVHDFVVEMTGIEPATL